MNTIWLNSQAQKTIEYLYVVDLVDLVFIKKYNSAKSVYGKYFDQEWLHKIPAALYAIISF